MDFSSIVFLWAFLPITLVSIWLAYYLLRKNQQKQITVSNILLLILSVFFYSWAGIKSTILLLCIIVINYFCGRAISSETDDKKKKARLIISIVINVLLLACFKYGNMIIVSVEGVLSLRDLPLKAVIINVLTMNRTNAIPIASVVLPLAISFLVFQSISYLVDVYKGKVEVEKNLFIFILYEIAFFQLVQGPIIRYSDFSPQLRSRELTVAKTEEGVRRFCFGLGKKVIIANTLALIVDSVWSQVDTIGSFDAWAALIMYAFQIYYDFSGYSDMAVGLGKMLGFEICENFNHPYVSKSIQEFWRRWHISLSSWFKDYIYIPLGGNRCSKGRNLFNIFIVFLTTGIWHGANWTFIFWGLWFAFLSIVERLFLLKLLKKNPVKILNWLYTFLAVVLGWALFRSPDMITAIRFITRLFSWEPSAGFFVWASYSSLAVLLAFVAAVIFMGPIQEKYGNQYTKLRCTRIGHVIDGGVCIFILFVSIILIINGSYSPSIYAGF